MRCRLRLLRLASPAAASRGLRAARQLRLTRGRIDVEQAAGVVDVDQHRRVDGQHTARARIAHQGEELVAAGATETHGMAALIAMYRAAVSRPRAIASRTARIVAGDTSGMSASAITQPAASRRARTPQASEWPMPASASSQMTSSAPSAASSRCNRRCASLSAGRTTAIASAMTARRLRSAETAIGTPR